MSNWWNNFRWLNFNRFENQWAQYCLKNRQLASTTRTEMRIRAIRMDCRLLRRRLFTKDDAIHSPFDRDARHTGATQDTSSMLCRTRRDISFFFFADVVSMMRNFVWIKCYKYDVSFILIYYVSMFPSMFEVVYTIESIEYTHVSAVPWAAMNRHEPPWDFKYFYYVYLVTSVRSEYIIWQRKCACARKFFDHN